MISISDFNFSQWWSYFFSSFTDVGEYFLAHVLSPITDVLFSSKLVVFTAVAVACSAISAIVYIILNSRSDSFDDCYIDSRISTPDMYSHVSENFTSFGYSQYRYFRNKKHVNEFFKNNPSFIYMTKDGVKFFSKDWNKKKFGGSFNNNKYKAMERYYFATNKTTNSKEKNIDISVD